MIGQPKGRSLLVMTSFFITTGDYYDMSSDPPGYVLIIDNVQFQGLSHRDGSDRNVDRLRKLFSDRGFKVIEEINLSSKVCGKQQRFVFIFFHRLPFLRSM